MKKTEVLQFIGEKSWFSDQAGIPSMYVSDVTELLMRIDASRESQSAVPGEEWLEKQLSKFDKEGKREDYLQGYSDCYYGMVDELKRGIAK